MSAKDELKSEILKKAVEEFAEATKDFDPRAELLSKAKL